MASRLTDEEERRLEFLLRGTDEEVFERFFYALHRNRPGQVVPLKANPLQQQLSDQIRRALQCNLQIQKAIIKEGGESYIEKLHQGAEIWPQDIGLRMMIGKSRRGGCSTWVGHIGLRRAISVPNQRILVMAHNADTAVELASMPRTTLAHWRMDDALRPTITRDGDDQLRFTTGGRYAIRTAGQAKRGASRGWGFDFYHFSEYAHYLSYTDAIQAKSVAQPHAWMFIESTANGTSGPFYEEWKEARYVHEVEALVQAGDFAGLSTWNGWFKFFFSWLDDPGLTDYAFEGEQDGLLSSADDYERNLMAVDPRFTLGRLKFRRRIIANTSPEVGMDPEQFFPQEYPATPEEMFQNTGAPVFSRPRLDAMELRAKAEVPKKVVLSRSGARPSTRPGDHNLVIYERPRPGRYYVIGADIGKGLKKDFSWAMVGDRTDGTKVVEVASLFSKTLLPSDFAHLVALLGEWYNTAFVVPEGSPSDAGVAFCQALNETIGYPLIYTQEDPTSLAPTGTSMKMGFSTTNQQKGYLVNTARAALHDRSLWLRTPEAIRQWKLYQESESGRFEAPQGEFDDSVISGCLMVWGNRSPMAPAVARRVDDPRREEADAKSAPQDRNMWGAVNAMIRAALLRNHRGRRHGDVLPAVDDRLRRG